MPRPIPNLANGSPPVCSRTSRCCVRDVRWRYLRYDDGSEEIYDLQADANEWRNLAADPTHAAVKARLAGALPKAESVLPPAR